jgi:dihydrofolate reductase
MIISMIAAVAKNGVIGKNNDLPWHLPDDMKFFMLTTQDHYVIMGRKNYESLPVKYRPLPRRTNIIITRQSNFQAPDCIIVHTLQEALAIPQVKGEAEVFVIGGAEIFHLGLPYAHRLYITEIDAVIEGDTYFPTLDKKDWKEISSFHHPVDAKHLYSFNINVFERVKRTVLY